MTDEPTGSSINPLKRRIAVAALIVANLVPLFGVLWLDWGVANLLLLFWLENVVIGAYTLLRMLRVQPVAGLFNCAFFLIHYGGFTGMHGMFLLSILKMDNGFELMPQGEEHWGGFLVFVQILWNVLRHVGTQLPDYFWIPLLALAASHGVSFIIYQILEKQDDGKKAGKIMVAPYGRIVVLHVAVILGGMFAMSQGSPMPLLLVLLTLKISLDVVMHLKSHAPRAHDLPG